MPCASGETSGRSTWSAARLATNQATAPTATHARTAWLVAEAPEAVGAPSPPCGRTLVLVVEMVGCIVISFARSSIVWCRQKPDDRGWAMATRPGWLARGRGGARPGEDQRRDPGGPGARCRPAAAGRP